MTGPHQSSTRGLLKSNVILFSLLAGIVIMAILVTLLTLEPQPPKIIRDISHQMAGSITLQGTYTFNEPIGVLAVSDGIMFYISEDTLFSRSIDSDKMNWQYTTRGSDLWARSIEVDDNSVYILTATHVTAFDKKTGSKIWSTNLGVGHVETILQITGQGVCIYYGDKIFLISPLTGHIKDKLERKNILWQNEQFEILEKDTRTIEGYDIVSNSLIWENRKAPFRVDRYFFPASINESEIITRTPDLGICRLNILDGVYLWCRNEYYKSNVGVDPSNNLVYAIRNDYALVAINALTGNIVDEIIFKPTELSSDMQLILFDYFVTVASGKVVIYFGDSNQIFVLNQK